MRGRLLRLLGVGLRRIALREPAFPALDVLLAAGATAVGGIDVLTVLELGPADRAAGPAVAQRAIHELNRVAGLERRARDAALDQRRRRRALEAPERLGAVRVLDVQVEPRVGVVERPAHDGAGLHDLLVA